MSKEAGVSPDPPPEFPSSAAAPAAFVLAAGLGTRLRPLTDTLPKPLVPLFHKPLITFAFDNLIAAGVGRLALNTHHLPESFAGLLGHGAHYRGCPLQSFHEPLLLDTGGGIRNARNALGEKTFFLYNGDILADAPLNALLARHRASGALATLLLRTGGGTANVRFDAASGRVLDVRGALGGRQGDLCVYTGIALVEPAIFDWIPATGPSSIIDSLIAALRAGENVGGLCADAGLWIDIGTPSAYLEAHRLLADPTRRPGFPVEAGWPVAIHPEALIDSSAVLEGVVVAGPRVMVGGGAFIRDSILWPGAVIGPGARIEECIVRGAEPVTGTHRGGVL